jgi:hypothetical protein
MKVPGYSKNQFANQMYTFCEINWEGLSKSGGEGGGAYVGTFLLRKVNGFV